MPEAINSENTTKTSNNTHVSRENVVRINLTQQSRVYLQSRFSDAQILIYNSFFHFTMFAIILLVMMNGTQGWELLELMVIMLSPMLFAIFVVLDIITTCISYFIYHGWCTNSISNYLICEISEINNELYLHTSDNCEIKVNLMTARAKLKNCAFGQLITMHAENNYVLTGFGETKKKNIILRIENPSEETKELLKRLAILK